ncbi:hypothetical protein NUM3379_39930 [Kineococcus sp. NUM-3379]
MPTRRHVLTAAAAALVPGCAGQEDPTGPRPAPQTAPGAAPGAAPGTAPQATPHPAALRARPPGTPPAGAAPQPGERPLGVAPRRDAVLLVPPGLPAGPLPLVIALHGSGGDAAGGLAPLRPLAEEFGLLLLAPASRGPTWDAVTGGYGPDVALLDRALERVFATVPVDADRVAVAGFSDGGSYALGLGLANGALLRRVVAFSPGFVPPAPASGRPAVFVAHGDDDDVLPVEETSRRIVPRLREAGYDVTYREFDGPHVVPLDVAREALEWLRTPRG